MVIGDSELGKGVGDIVGVRIRGEEGEGGSVELGGEIGGGGERHGGGVVRGRFRPEARVVAVGRWFGLRRKEEVMGTRDEIHARAGKGGVGGTGRREGTVIAAVEDGHHCRRG